MIRSILPGNIASSKGTSLPYVIFLSLLTHKTHRKSLAIPGEAFSVPYDLFCLRRQKKKSGQGKALSYGETALKKESRKALFFYSAPSGILAIIVLYTCRKNSSVRVRENTSAMG